MLDYLAVKKFHAKKLAEDAEGGGRVESAFYHTMKMVYLKGVEDGRQTTPPGYVMLSELALEQMIGRGRMDDLRGTAQYLVNTVGIDDRRPAHGTVTIVPSSGWHNP